MQSGIASTMMSIAVIAAFALGGGGMWLIARRGDVKKGALMLIAALVMLANVLIWTI